jgi:NADH dehydrogenase FAD-containing subunit
MGVVDGKMVQIDREKKLIALQNGDVLRYDYLILTTGLQDQTIFQLSELAENQYPETPVQMISLSSRPSAQVLEELLKQRSDVNNGKVLVYGSFLNVYCAVQGNYGFFVEISSREFTYYLQMKES